MKIKPKKPKWISPTSLNPLVMKLNIIRDKVMLNSQIEQRIDEEYDMEEVDAYERKRIFAHEFYMPSAFVWDIYKAISEMIEFGYRFKNIAYPSFYADMNRAAMDVKKASEGKIHADKKIRMGGCTIGPSGIGKSEAIERALALFPNTIIHPAQDTAYKKPFLQIPYIKADLNAKSTLSVLRDLLAEIDEKAGTSYYDDNPVRKGEGPLIAVVANACWQYGIGLVVLDEAQMLITESGKANGKDSPNAKFLQLLFNSLNVPILLIGTPELEEFLPCNAHTFRRYKKDADITLYNYPENSEYWKNLVEIIIQKYVFCRNVAVSDTNHRQIYVYTAGNYSVLQIFCKKLIEHVDEENIKCLSENLLKDVYEIKKSAMNKLTSLHNKPIVEISAKVSKKGTKRAKKAVPMPNEQCEDSVAKQKGKELGRAAHALFRTN